METYLASYLLSLRCQVKSLQFSQLYFCCSICSSIGLCGFLLLCVRYVMLSAEITGFLFLIIMFWIMAWFFCCRNTSYKFAATLTVGCAWLLTLTYKMFISTPTAPEEEDAIDLQETWEHVQLCKRQTNKLLQRTLDLLSAVHTWNQINCSYYIAWKMYGIEPLLHMYNIPLVPTIGIFFICPV